MKVEKICFITDRYPTNEYPVNTFLDQLVCQFADMGIKCTVIAPHSVLLDKVKKNKYNPAEHWIRKTKEGSNISVYCPKMPFVIGKKIAGINFFKFYNKAFSAAVQKAFQKYNIDTDVFYAHFILPAGLAASDIALKYNKPYFIAYGESSIDIIKNKYDLGYVREKLKNISGVIAVSSKNKKELTVNKIVSNEKISVFPNAIDTSSFYLMDRTKVREELGISDSSFIVAFVGHYIHRKGTLRLSRAIDRLNGVNSFFIGAGDEHPDCKGILFSGRLPHEDIVKYLNAADIFVLPTLAEGCCNAIVEAMACGLPVISSNLPFNDDILDESCSIRINSNSVEELAEAIQKLKDDVNLREYLAKGAFEKAKSLTIDKRAEAILRFIIEKAL